MCVYNLMADVNTNPPFIQSEILRQSNRTTKGGCVCVCEWIYWSPFYTWKNPVDHNIYLWSNTCTLGPLRHVILGVNQNRLCGWNVFKSMSRTHMCCSYNLFFTCLPLTYRFWAKSCGVANRFTFNWKTDSGSGLGFFFC